MKLLGRGEVGREAYIQGSQKVPGGSEFIYSAVIGISENFRITTVTSSTNILKVSHAIQSSIQYSFSLVVVINKNIINIATTFHYSNFKCYYYDTKNMPCCQLIAKIVFSENNKGNLFLGPVTEDGCAKRKRKHIAMYQYSDNLKRLFPFTVSSSFCGTNQMKELMRIKNIPCINPDN